MTVSSARAIEERNSRKRFVRHWIVAAASPANATPTMRLAVDNSQRIIAADRVVCATFSLDQHMLESGLDLRSIFERNLVPFRRREPVDVSTMFVSAERNEPWAATGRCSGDSTAQAGAQQSA
jgi:transcriptional regulator of acetoin/glycerol metabolism